MTYATVFTLLVTGGITTKVLELIYKEFRTSRDKKNSAKDLINKHLDPILKSADELVGKIGSSAKQDFQNLTTLGKPESFDQWIPYLNIIYLFSQFWARIQILRIESIFIDFTSTTHGEQLNKFINALESKRTRLFERSWQRGMGEGLLEINEGNNRVVTFKEFVEWFHRDEKNQQWFRPLVDLFVDIKNKDNRQSILIYGTILHALIDFLDPLHKVTKDRPNWCNKLSQKTISELERRVFPTYLPFVESPSIYTKKKGPKKGPNI